MSGALAMLLGASSGPTFTPAAGTYTVNGSTEADFTIDVDQAVVWTWTRTNPTNTASSVPSGNSDVEITFSCSAIDPTPPLNVGDTLDPNSVTFNVTATFFGSTVATYTVNLNCSGGIA